MQCSQCIPSVSYRNPLSSAGRCDKCGSSAMMKLIVYLAGCALIALTVYGVGHSGVNIRAVTVLIEFAQLLSIIGAVKVCTFARRYKVLHL